MAALFCILVGCQRAPTLGKVSGKVTLDGQPVSEGRISFNDASRGIFMTADLRADGSYEVVRAEGHGLPPGTYQVAVTPLPSDLPVGFSSTAPPKRFSEIPAKYHNPATSGLTLTVAQETNPFDVALRR